MSEPSSSYDRWTLRDDSTVQYGYFDQQYHPPNSDSNKFYITTAINYTNGPAHMGHAYEAVTSDVIARYHRLLSDKTFFLTGSDEHGQKIAETAARQQQSPIDICNQYVTGFQVLNQRSLISNNDYVRTTSDRHKQVARQLWRRCAHDIYLDHYVGWYNVKEETFVTEKDAELHNYKDPDTGIPYKQVQEESYFFKMSKYKDRLIQYIEVEQPDFIQPSHQKELILKRLKSDELRDLSISRTTFDWGISVPEGFHDHHVMYVWMDALTNYLTGVNGLEENDGTGFWPADVHIIGKDILWFHTVIWPCLLMSANVPLPKVVFAHGFVNDKKGVKMSKSLGNVVDPHDMLDKFHVDTFRWYLCKEAPFGGELSFSETSMTDMHNADLIGNLGNLVSRVAALCKSMCGGTVPDVSLPGKLPVADLPGLFASYKAKMDAFDLQGGAFVAMEGFRSVNGYLQETEPWKLKHDPAQQQIIVRATLEAVYCLSHLVLPFLPVGGAQIFEKLNTPPVTVSELNLEGTNLKVGTAIVKGEVMYSVVGMKEEKESYADAQKRKKAEKAAKAAHSQEALHQSDFTRIDIRVGKINKVWNHPGADKLYCEEIEVGEESPRAIASGLREYYSLEELYDRKVLVVCNLKATKLVGFSSSGMVLAAKKDGKVELVDPPADATVGERVFIEGLSGEPTSSTQVRKKKLWEKVAEKLATSDSGEATWDDKVIATSAGPCKAASLTGAPIS